VPGEPEGPDLLDEELVAALGDGGEAEPLAGACPRSDSSAAGNGPGQALGVTDLPVPGKSNHVKQGYLGLGSCLRPV
jgi:hypothetical protein